MIGAIRGACASQRNSQPLRRVLLATFLFMLCGAESWR